VLVYVASMGPGANLVWVEVSVGRWLCWCRTGTRARARDSKKKRKKKES
jgi:hypothetical protein